MDVKEIVTYLEKNRDEGHTIGVPYKTLKAAKIASYFKPYLAWHNGALYFRGKNLLAFS